MNANNYFSSNERNYIFICYTCYSSNIYAIYVIHIITEKRLLTFKNILFRKVNNQCFVNQMLCTKLLVAVTLPTLCRQKETSKSK